MSRPELAPNCFGSVVAFAVDSQVCKRCLHYQDCEASAYDAIRALQQEPEVVKLLGAHKKAQAQMKVELPPLLQTQVDQRLAEFKERLKPDLVALMRETWDAGHNPMEGTGSFLDITFAQLLQESQSKSTLLTHFETIGIEGDLARLNIEVVIRLFRDLGFAHWNGVFLSKEKPQ